MFLRISVFILLSIFTSWDATRADEPFNNETAKSAQKTYEQAVEKAKKEYLEQLEIAIKEAGGAGDLAEANRIAAERDAIRDSEDDPIDRLRKRLEGSRWGINRNLTLKLNPKRKVVFAAGYPGTWILADEKTLILQSSRSANIEMWKFDESLRSAKKYTFELNKDKTRDYKRYD